MRHTRHPENILFASKRYFLNLLETLPDALFFVDGQHKIVYANATAATRVGATKRELLGRSLWQSAPHLVSLELDRALVWARQTHEPLQVEYRSPVTATWLRTYLLPISEGTVLSFRESTEPSLCESEGANWVGIPTYTDKQKQARQVREACEAQLHVLAETMPQLVWSTRPDGYLEYWNQRFANYLQASPEELRGYGWRQFLHPEEHETVTAVRTRSLETGEPYEMEYRLREGRTGAYRWFLARGAPVYDEAGQIVRWFGTCTDIEDQKRIEEALRASQERAQALMESSIMGIIIIDGETLIEANDAFLQMTGYTREDVRNGMLSLSKIMSPEYASHNQLALEEFATSQQVRPYETAYVCKDGNYLPILAGEVALPHHPSQRIGFVLDNSARKELERRKDDFISMASHELKTPLTSLRLQAQLLRKKLERQENAISVPVLSRMEEQVKCLERLVGEFLDVSKIQVGRLEYIREKVELDTLLHDIAETMQQMSTTHTISVHGATHISLIGDRDRLGQVFTNLISNAIKYSPAASTVDVEISAHAEKVLISVHDQGIGIPREQHEKIFERFYRAVAPSQKAFPGLGMGLYIVAEIVKQHGGAISVESVVGEGSTFQVTLPLEK